MVPIRYDDESTQRAYEAGWWDGVGNAQEQQLSDMLSRFEKNVEKIRKSWKQQAALNLLNDEMKLIDLIDQHPEIFSNLVVGVMASIMTEDERFR